MFPICLNEVEHLLLMNLNGEHLSGGIEISVRLSCLYLVNGVTCCLYSNV